MQDLQSCPVALGSGCFLVVSLIAHDTMQHLDNKKGCLQHLILMQLSRQCDLAVWLTGPETVEFLVFSHDFCSIFPALFGLDMAPAI